MCTHNNKWGEQNTTRNTDVTRWQSSSSRSTSTSLVSTATSNCDCERIYSEAGLGLDGHNGEHYLEKDRVAHRLRRVRTRRHLREQHSKWVEEGAQWHERLGEARPGPACRGTLTSSGYPCTRNARFCSCNCALITRWVRLRIRGERQESEVQVRTCASTSFMVSAASESPQPSTRSSRSMCTCRNGSVTPDTSCSGE